jgi:RpiR family carbohydrate utilization transcriptional regulator
MGRNNSRSQTGLVPITLLLKRLRRKRRALMQRVLENPRQHVLSSIRTLARELKAQPSTVLRAVQAMGFDTYKDFQRYLHELSVIVATPLDLMKESNNTNSGITGHVSQTLDDALKNLRTLRNSLDPSQLERLAKQIYSADRILIIGGDLASSLVWFLEYSFLLLGLPVMAATSYGATMHLTRSARPRDVVIAISFRRGLRQTIEGLLQARLKNAYCVGITDSVVSPIAMNSDQHFLASIESSSYGGSYVSPMALLDTILVACAQYRRKRTLRLLKEAERESRSGTRWYADKSAQG